MSVLLSPQARPLTRLSHVNADRSDLEVPVGKAVGPDGDPAGLQSVLAGAAELLNVQTAEVLTRRFGRVLGLLGADQGTRLGGVEVLGEAERRQLPGECGGIPWPENLGHVNPLSRAGSRRHSLFGPIRMSSRS